jgi:hypothetical protein
MELVAYPFAEGVRAFTTLCASRAEQAGTNQPFFEHASAAALWAIKLYEQKEREAAAKALAEGPSLALRALAFASQRAEEAGARARARAAEKLSELQARNAARQGRVNSALSDEAGTGNRRANQGDVPPKPLLLAVLKPPCSALEWEEMLPALRQAAASRGGIGSGVAGSTDAGLVVVGAGLDVCNGFYKHVPDDALANGKPFFRNDDRSVPFFQQTTIGWSDTEWTRKKGYPEGVGCWGIAYDGHHRYMARGDSPFPPTTGWEVREDPKWKYPSVAPTLDLAHMAVPHTERLLRGVHPEAVAKVLLALMQLDDRDESGLDAAAASAAHIRSQLVDDSSAESVSMREAKPEMCGDLDVILNDIPRTWLDWQIETVGESGRFSAEDLRVILDAQVCAAESDLGAVGYSQGMADLAAWLLMRPLSRTAAYSALRRFSSLPLLRLCWRLDLDEWDALGAAARARSRAFAGVSPVPSTPHLCPSPVRSPSPPQESSIQPSSDEIGRWSPRTWTGSASPPPSTCPSGSCRSGADRSPRNASLSSFRSCSSRAMRSSSSSQAPSSHASRRSSSRRATLRSLGSSCPMHLNASRSQLSSALLRLAR